MNTKKEKQTIQQYVISKSTSISSVEADLKKLLKTLKNIGFPLCDKNHRLTNIMLNKLEDQAKQTARFC